ncbi:MAG: acyl-CoA dehydrogenase family protein [Thermoplasmatales archaeon]|nr:acyl-CoA dehydrogenase family protein [Thermoplasmatales archaeon]
MDLRLSDEETQIRDAARKFAQREIQPLADRMDREDYFPRDVFAKLGEEGFLAVTLPERWGGLGLSYIAQALVLEEIARVSPALALSVGAHSNLMADNLARNGTDAQRDRYLPSLARGKTIGALALTEPDAGSDALSLRTAARKDGSGYRLSGSKQFITNGPIADVLLVYAKTDPKAGARGISAFLVTKGSPGFTVSRSLDKMGMRGSPTGELSFQDVPVPADHLVGRENEGVAIVMSGLNVERAVLSGIPLGIMEECLARATSYAREREQFGQKIGRFELIAAKLAGRNE